jgi:hypothetical protein
MRTFVLHHRHEADECDATFASWAGFQSPLRHERVPSTCLGGGHGLYWTVQAANVEGALALLPPFVAERTQAIQVREVEIP